MPAEKIIVAIDGPAGAGKSTVAKLVAQKLGFLYIDTGAMYRALTLKAKRRSLDTSDEVAMYELMKNTAIRLSQDQQQLKVFLDGEDVSEEIRTPSISDAVSVIAKIKGVRALMTRLQREFAKNNNAVLEGRDIGTVVFPNAPYKFFIDAQFKERVRRRHKEMKEKKQDVALAHVERDLSFRDNIDSTRECAPLKKADDAVYVDTTDLSIEQVVDKITSAIQK